MERIRMTDVVSLLGLPQPSAGRISCYVHCPCCDGERDRHLNINFKKEVFRCAKCGVSGGIFDLYALFTGTDRDRVWRELAERLRLNERPSLPEQRSYQQPVEISLADTDTRHRIQIDQVMVFPQAFAAVVPQSDMVLNTSRLFIIDIGGYTTDVLLLQNGKPDLQFCRSLETGVITLNNEVIRKVSSQYDMKIDDEHISNVLQGKEKYLPDEVREVIYTAAKLHANDILNQLRELQIDLRSNPAIFIGGGSILLQSYLSESPLAGTAEFIDLPNANAVGYEMLGEKQLARLRG